ncbi:MAG: hypothetical protein WDO14_12510 [Bacteroidota bacterium]
MILHILLYIDPGIGSVIIQAIIAGVLGFFYTLKVYGNKIKSIFTRKKNEPPK